MKTVKISLNSIDKVKSFVNDITSLIMTLISYQADTLSMLNLLWVFSVWIFLSLST